MVDKKVPAGNLFIEGPSTVRENDFTTNQIDRHLIALVERHLPYLCQRQLIENVFVDPAQVYRLIP